MKYNLDFIENLSSLLNRIEQKKKQIDNARPLPSSAINRIKQDIGFEWTYNSNAIEGNSLTLAETRVVLEDGMTIGGKSLREHFEIINHEAAIHYVEDLVTPDYQMRAIDILNIHKLILKNIDKDYAGRLRNGMVRIIGANFTPPSPNLVSDLIDELVSFINESDIPIPILAALFHHQFVWIHPFFDGNGRTGRLLMNILLLKAGYPPAIILKNDRKKYYAALNLANKGNHEKLCLMVLQGLERSLNMYINIIPNAYGDYQEISSIIEDPEIPYGMEYISLLARRGEINAHKEGRSWLTTKVDVMNYAKSKGKI
jgi:Fic family protein